MKYLVYILKCSDNTLYTGVTNNIDRRMKMHNSGKGSKYVRARLPFKVVYKENFKSRSEAQKREYEIKQMTRLEKESLMV